MSGSGREFALGNLDGLLCFVISVQRDVLLALMNAVVKVIAIDNDPCAC